MIFIPELYPTPDLDHDNLYIDSSNPNIPIFFGLFDKKLLPKFYLTKGSSTSLGNPGERPRYTYKQLYFTLQDGKWAPTKAFGGGENAIFEPDQYRDKIGTNTMLFLETYHGDSKNEKGAGHLYKDNFAFKIEDIKENSTIRITTSAGVGDTYEYRGWYGYKLLKENGKWVLQNRLDHSIKITLKEKTYTENWHNTAGGTTTP